MYYLGCDDVRMEDKDGMGSSNINGVALAEQRRVGTVWQWV